VAEAFRVEGGHQLAGVITPAGNKNEALPAIAAALLTDEEVILDNVPAILDVKNMLGLVESLGVSVSWRGPNTVAICARGLSGTSLDPEVSARIRGSVLLAGPLVARLGRVEMAQPGGDRIGRRRVDTHLLALAALGATWQDGEALLLEAPRGLRGAELFLDEASVTGTENAVMAAALAPGETVILNAAGEPHVRRLCELLNAMGARIEGHGSNVLRITGVERLGGARHRIGCDFLEVGSFIGLAAATHSALTVRDAGPRDLSMVRIVMQRLGVDFEIDGDSVHIPADQDLRVRPDFGGAIPKIDDAPWPGFPADLVSIALVVATQAEGTVLIHEKLYESRLFFVDRLIDMGAKIVLCDPHRAVIAGPNRLHGANISSPDIRAGMALLIAALCADGWSTIHNIQQIDRGYEQIDTRLQALGACIERVEL
jgi:UDP-N-acetylglucosamine 1-carboxyvinyltransferase